jgi:hypothetical protein
MNHFEKLRKHLHGADIHPLMKAQLYRNRQTEIRMESQHAAAIQSARESGRCAAIIMPTIGRYTMYRDTPPTPGRICCEPATRRGYCNGHFITHFLHIRDRKSGRAGEGVTVRPFAAFQFPIGALSPCQEDLMNDLERLPLKTSREDCLAKVNAEHPSNILSLPTRDRLTKRRTDTLYQAISAR